MTRVILAGATGRTGTPVGAALAAAEDIDLVARVAAVIARTQKIPSETVTLDKTFEELKIDSLDGINIRMISQGASEINMSFMIEEDDADEAVRSLHAAFFANPDPTIFDTEARKAAVSS